MNKIMSCWIMLVLGPVGCWYSGTRQGSMIYSICAILSSQSQGSKVSYTHSCCFCVALLVSGSLPAPPHGPFCWAYFCRLMTYTSLTIRYLDLSRLGASLLLCCGFQSFEGPVCDSTDALWCCFDVLTWSSPPPHTHTHSTVHCIWCLLWKCQILVVIPFVKQSLFLCYGGSGASCSMYIW